MSQIIDTQEALIREQIAAGNMDYQPSGDTAKHLCGIIDRLRASNDRTMISLDAQVAENTSLRLALASAHTAAEQAQRDAVRLDWLIANACHVYPTNEAGAKLHIFTGPQHRAKEGRYAIDAAMEAQPSSQGGEKEGG